MTAPRVAAVHCRQVQKQFSGRAVVRDFTLEIAAGTVHALVGENGAGKSTLLGLLSGRHAPDAGDISIFGEPLPLGSPVASRRAGMAAIYQELTTFDTLSACANVFAGQNLHRRQVLHEKEMRARFTELASAFDLRIDPRARSGDLPVSQRQVLEILRGIQAQARILLFDEPTAALAEHERASFHKLVSQLRTIGKTVVLVSHNLDEVLELSDHITVMRNGDLVGNRPAAAWTKAMLVEAMVGHEVKINARVRSANTTSSPALQINNVTIPKRIHDVSVSVHAGEILGLWGLVGSGRTSLMRAVAGLEPTSVGQMVLSGESVTWPKTPKASQARGIALLPEDRKSALSLGQSAVENINLGRADRGIFARKTSDEQHARIAERFGLDPRRMHEPVRQLSGGNQQKVLLAKWVARRAKVLLVDEPTRGIDIAAKAAVLASLVDMAADGFAIVVTSSDLEEVLSVCHRLLVMASGTVVHEIAAGSSEFTTADVVRMGFANV